LNYEKFSAKTRNEIPQKYKWDLSSTYKNLKDWNDDFEKLPKMLKNLKRHRGKLSNSPDEIRRAFEKEDEISRLTEKLSSFARQKSDEDSSDNSNLALCGKISAKSAEIDAEIAWIDPELLSMDEKKLIDFANNPRLSFYKKTILDLIREKPHTLSAEEEKLLGLASDALSSSYDTFNLLSNADMRFPRIKDEKSVQTELSHSNFLLFLRKKKRSVRKEAFEKFYGRYSEFQNTFASILDGTIKTDIFETRARKFDDCLQAALFDDRIPKDLYEGLISSVRTNLPLLHHYFSRRRKKLGLKKMHLYDIHHSLVEAPEIKWSWEDAQKAVLDSLSPLGREYCDFARKAFDERWIDVLPNKGKRSGAYSGGSYDSPPYILMNFNGTLDDVFTLAHELGHSMHSFYSNKTQKYHYADYSIFLAEIASISSELLLHENLLRNSQEKSPAPVLLNHLIDEFKATVVRQTMFAEFELIIHRRREEDECLTAEFLKTEYYRLVSEYFGPDVFCDKLIEHEWARIPHFHYGFYVYKYATGFAAAAKFAKMIVDGEQDAVKKYLNFISSGSSKDVLDILKDSGINPLEKDFMNNAFKLFGEKSEAFWSILK